MGNLNIDDARSRWFDALCEQVLSLAGPSIGIARLYVPLSSRPDLGAAAVVAWICSQARKAVTTAQIAERLLHSGALSGCASPDLSALVRDVRSRWAQRGLPIADWWDDEQLLRTLLMYMAPRLAAERGETEAGNHTREVFGLPTGALIDYLVSRPLSPPPLPPVPHDMVVGSDREHVDAIRALMPLLRRTEIAMEVTYLQSRSLLGGAGLRRCGQWERSIDHDLDAWLGRGQETVLTWARLSRLVGHAEPEGSATLIDARLSGLEPDALAVAQSAVDAAWQECVEWIDSLTEVEQTLIEVQDDNELRRRRWLDGHLRIHRASLQAPDCVPDITSPGTTPDAPAWVATNVFDRGGRFFHNITGPMALWFGVIESDHEQHELMSSLDGDIRMAITEDGADVVLWIAVGPRDGPDSLFVPFRFFPEEPSSAVELLVVLRAGVRLDWYRLLEDQILEHLHGDYLDIPADTLTHILERVDSTLVRAERASPEALPLELLGRALQQHDLKEGMFVGVDNAKSESIRFDIDLLEMDTDRDTEAVRQARERLAQAELARVSAYVDSAADLDLQTQADFARHTYAVTRQRVQRSHRRRFADLTLDVVSNDRAFVHLTEADGYLAAVTAIDTGDGIDARFVDLSHVPAGRIRLAADFWLGHDPVAQWEQLANALDGLLRWVGREIIAPLVDLLHRYGTRHVVFCPSGALDPLPLHAALVDGQPLGDLMDVSYAPSAAVISRLCARSDQRATLDLVVAANGAAAPPTIGLDVLDGPDEEAIALSALATEARVLSGVDATPATALRAIADSRVAHIAAHAAASSDKLASGIWLSGRSPSSALLSAASIHAGPALLDTSLVVLNACDTAQHPVGGRAVQAWRGLDSAFLARGARAVVASLWGVDDVAALVYGTVLHVRLFDGATLTQAHADATAVLRGQDPEPRAIGLLDKARPSWRADLRCPRLESAYGWAAYRLSGVCW